MDIENVIKTNKDLLYKIASYFYGVDVEDLYQAGIVGLIKAYNNYQKSATCKFSTYAYEYIYGEMYNLAINHSIKVNKETLKLYKLIEKTRYTLAQKINRIPSNTEISQFLNIDEKIINDAIIAGQKIESLDNDLDRPLYEMVPGNDLNMDNQILIKECLNNLTEEERKIVIARYYDDLSQCEVARKLSLSQAKVSRYEKKSLNKMYDYLSINQ